MPVYRLIDQYIFPSPELAEENGLLAVGGDLHPQRLLEAYRQGIFPWFGKDDPILWWFTSPRLILEPAKIHIPKRLARSIRNEEFAITFDQAFHQVIDECASIRHSKREETWITDTMKTAYRKLHSLGYAHSVEYWREGQLEGGLYGVAIGSVFFGESMFSRKKNASKIALVALATLLEEKEFALIDCQMTTTHLLQFGAQEITGKEFSNSLHRYIHNLLPDGHWNHETFNRNRCL